MVPELALLQDFEAIETPDARAQAVTSLAAMLPVFVILLLVSAMLWGIDETLPLVDASSNDQTTVRDTVAWTALGLLLTIVAGVLVTPVTRFLRGTVPRSPSLRHRLNALERRRYRRLLRKHFGDSPGRSGSGTQHSLATAVLSQRFPDFSELRVTQLGNALAAVSSRVGERHELLLSVAWSRLFTMLPDEARRTVVVLERRRDVAIAVTAGSLVACVISTAVAIGYSDRVLLAWVGPAAAVALALRVYGVAVSRAIDHGRAVEGMVDVHVAAFLEAMGMGRPENLREQQQLCRALSQILANLSSTEDRRGVPSGASLNREVLGSIQRSVDDAITSLPKSLESAVQEVLPTAFADALPEALDRLVVPAVARGIAQGIEGPPLTNYDGWVSVRIEGPPDCSPLFVTPEREVIVTGDGEHTIHVIIAAQPTGVSTRLAIDGGRDAAEVTFDIAVDSDRSVLRRPPERMTLSTAGGHANARIALTLDRARDHDGSLLIRVLQRRRMVQTLDFRIVSRGPD